MTANEKAFLDTISFSEGTYGKGDSGYNVLVGGSLFTTYADHPRTKVYIQSLNLYSTAAGRYQLLARYFDAYRSLLHLNDFTPLAQDTIALQQILECKAIGPINDGDFDEAVSLCAHIWASLPGAGYGQRENKMSELRSKFVEFGGTLSS